MLLLALLSVGSSVLGPRAIGAATDVIVHGLTQGRPGGLNHSLLRAQLGLALALYATSGLAAYGNARLLTRLVQRTGYELRRQVEEKVHRLELAYVDAQQRGDLLSRVTNDMDNMQQSLQQSLSQLLSSVLLIIGTTAMMLSISGALAAIAALALPLAGLTLRLVSRRSRPSFLAQWDHTGRLNGIVEETLTGHEIVRAFGRQSTALEAFSIENEQLYRASLRAQLSSGLVGPVLTALGALQFVVICVLGGLQVSTGRMSIGEVQAFIQYSRQFSQPVTQVASMFGTLQSGLASAERVFAFLDAPEQTSEVTIPDTPAAPRRGAVDFQHVGFSYRSARPLIQDLNLSVEPGSTVAIVGPTGAGKTTLVNLLMRFYDLQTGRILLDGQDIREMPRAELRSGMAMVLQDAWLFHGSIRDNIAYGRLDATEEQIRQAARDAHVDHFVGTLGDGYDTLVDNDHSALSVGEKQLITIARAFLADPLVLILDEATSAVDTRTELLIQRAMTALRAERTCFVIAHRLSTIRTADSILVMERGRIVEHGTHAELIAADGSYASLHRSQEAAAPVEI